ncbi:MAG: hypothetical protein ACHBN1_32445 [Heteroscytonema crispum UTEX LB 1556]
MADKKRNVPVNTVVKVGRQGTRYEQKTTASQRTSGYIEEYQEEEYEVVIDRTAAEILDKINRRLKKSYYSTFIGIPTSIFGISAMVQIGNPPVAILLLLLFMVGTVVTYRVYEQDIIRKTTPLTYEFDDEYSRQKFDGLVEALKNLSSTQSVWRLKSQIAIEDWKRNAGSQSIIVRQSSRIGQINPNLIKTNINAWGIDSGNIKLYLLPDSIFLFQNGVYTTITYDALKVAFQELEFTEHETLPRDATVIGHTWKFVRRDGEADRRFNNNRQIPIVNYGLVKLATQHFALYLIVSSLKVSASFTNSFSRFLGLSQIDSLQKEKSQYKKDIPHIENELPEKFEILAKAAIEKTQLTTTEVATLLGISKSSVTKNQESFEYEGFRFSREGRKGREIAWQVTKLKK